MPWVRAVGWSECFMPRAPCLFCSEWSCVFIWTPGPCSQVPQRIGGQLRTSPCEVQALQVPNIHTPINLGSGCWCLPPTPRVVAHATEIRAAWWQTKLYPHVDRTVSELGLTRSLPISHRVCWEVSHWFCQEITCWWDNLSAFPLWTPKAMNGGSWQPPTSP